MPDQTEQGAGLAPAPSVSPAVVVSSGWYDGHDLTLLGTWVHRVELVTDAGRELDFVGKDRVQALHVACAFAEDLRIDRVVDETVERPSEADPKVEMRE